MALAEHKVYNSPEKLADLLRGAAGDIKSVAIPLLKDAFNFGEVCDFMDAYEQAQGDKAALLEALAECGEYVQTPTGMQPAEHDDPKATPIG